MFREDQSTTPLYLVVDFFKTGLVPIYMYIIDLKEQRHDKFLNERSYKQIFTDVKASLPPLYKDATDGEQNSQYKNVYNHQLFYETKDYIIEMQ